MKAKKLLSFLIAIALGLSSLSALATDAPTADLLIAPAPTQNGVLVEYNDVPVVFDIEPIIENGRTLVPFRAILETMGCAVYYSAESGKQVVSARRGDDYSIITIGENKMYFNGEEIALDVPAKIKEGRTLVPLEAISAAFECEVHWNGEKREVRIYSPANAYIVSTEKLAETITDDEGNVLIEAVAYYPVLENSTEIPCLDTINSDYKRDAEKFLEEARSKKKDALSLRKEIGEAFAPFVFELTYEQTYGIWGYLSFTNHKYINVGSVHPTKTMESRTYYINAEEEMALSDVIIKESPDLSFEDFTANLFSDKLNELSPDSAKTYTYDYVKEYIGSLQFYITKNSLVLYFDQGVLAPYALGMVSVEIPYDPQLFNIDMRYNYEEEHLFEYEFDAGYEWRVFDYAKDKLVITEETIDYSPDQIYSEQYPVGLKKVKVKGIKKGNSALILAHVKKGKGIETATQIYISSFYVDEDNMLTLVTEEDGMFLINK